GAGEVVGRGPNDLNPNFWSSAPVVGAAGPQSVAIVASIHPAGEFVSNACKWRRLLARGLVLGHAARRWPTCGADMLLRRHGQKISAAPYFPNHTTRPPSLIHPP